MVVRRRTAVAIAAVALPIALGGAAQAASRPHASARPMTVPVPASAHHLGVFRPAHAGQALPRQNAASSSLNWAGWVSNVRGITGVQSTYVVPRAKFSPPGFSASWTGIGGYSTNDLIQAGTASDSIAVSGLPKYFAWVETLPKAEQRLINCTGDPSCSVSPGNKMFIDIHLVGRNLWSVSVTNVGHWSWRLNMSYVSSLTSADWILEAPNVGGLQTTVAQVGSAYFGPGNNFTYAGRRYPIASGNPVRVHMGLPGTYEAIASKLAPSHQAFRVCTYAATCPAPAG
jgi:hypothetical protein